MPTFAADDRLPRIPLPTLEDSCARFLAWCAPLLTPAQLAETEAEVAAFLAPGGPGRPLHEALEKYDAAQGVHSWLDTFWPYRYLGRRDRIALNANFFFLFKDDDAPAGQVERATALIAGALAHKRLVDAEELPAATQRGNPLSMDQQRFLFSTTRIPGETQDTVRAPYGLGWPGPSPARHVLVLRQGNLYRLDVVREDGTALPAAAIAAGLTAVLGRGDAPNPDAAGHLTSEARAAWAADRQALLALDPANADALETVETALFCVCLEDLAPADDLQACDVLLHGDSGNRWFDKAVSFVVFADGRAGINVEHCLLDGTTVLAFVESVLAHRIEEDGGAGECTPRPVSFVLDDALRAATREAAASFAEYAAATATSILDLPGFGAERAKALRVSPDAFVQLAYQLAHRRAKGLTGATYESIATRAYRRGRTEAMRVVTPEVVAFADAMEDPAADGDARRAAFRTAAEAHVRRARECQAGQAPEQHLWELQLIQRRQGAGSGVAEEPALFRTPGWLVMREDYLSTSSAPSATISHFGFGSTSNRCIGVGYVLLPDRFTIYLSTPRTQAAGMDAFARHLAAAVPELVELLAGVTAGESRTG